MKGRSRSKGDHKDRPYGHAAMNKWNPHIHNRRSIRLAGYDYSLSGAYFVTVCTQHGNCLFGEIVGSQMALNTAGRMVQTVWEDLPLRFPFVQLDQFIVMPNHFHAVIVFPAGEGQQPSGLAPNTDYQDRPQGTLPNTLGRIIQAFKSLTTCEYVKGVRQYGWSPFPQRLWQRNYYEHIVKSEHELEGIRRYIIDNPMKWESDREDFNLRALSDLQRSDFLPDA